MKVMILMMIYYNTVLNQDHASHMIIDASCHSSYMQQVFKKYTSPQTPLYFVVLLLTFNTIPNNL